MLGAEAFLSWLVFAWNNDVYLKKPITFSGSCFCVWNGSCRHKIGSGDLMHYYRKRIKLVPFLRSPDEECDFRNRPWWEWGVNVLRPVVGAMKEHEEWGGFSDRLSSRCSCWSAAPPRCELGIATGTFAPASKT